MYKKFLLKSGKLSALSLITIGSSLANVPYTIEGTIKTGNNRSYIQGCAFLPVIQSAQSLDKTVVEQEKTTEEA